MLGFQTQVAENGEKAFHEAQINSYQLIISDIRMPIWDGARFLQEIRKISAASPPFVFMTGFADISPQDAYAMGADAYVGKPFDPDYLSGIIDRLLLPLPEQLFQTIEEKVDHKIFGNPESISIGRRGFFLCGLIDPKKLKVGELVAFDLQCDGCSLPYTKMKGLGRVRWTMAEGNETLSAGCGVEILRLEEPSPDVLIRFAIDNRIIPVIPKGEKKISEKRI
jgi:CheY-like chemotaxis protein